jgi:hypothetical protein
MWIKFGFLFLGESTLALKSFTEVLFAILGVVCGSLFLAFGKDFYDRIRDNCCRLGKSLSKSGKTGEYHAIQGNEADRLFVGKSPAKSVKALLSGESYVFIATAYDEDFRIVEFRIRCEELDHEVGRGTWGPWQKNPNRIHLLVTFHESGIVYEQVFRKIKYS